MPRILIVEDDPATQNYLGRLLAGAGFEVQSAPTGKEGLIEAWRGLPDLIILDLALPDLDGLTVLAKLRHDRRTALTKIVGFTGRSNPDQIRQGLQAGLDACLVKRAGADHELIARVHELLGPPVSPATPVKRGKIVSCLSAKGGTGTTSLCVNVADVLARMVDPAPVAIVDLVLPIGSIAQLVGSSGDRNIVTVSQTTPAVLNAENVQPAVETPEGWQAQALAGAPDPNSAQDLNVAQLPAVLEVLQSMYDYLFIDHGRALSRISLPIIQESHAVVLVLGPDLSTVALTRQVVEFLLDKGVIKKRLFLILNRAVGLEGMSKAEIEAQIGLPIVAAVPYLREKLVLANNYRQPFSTKFPDDTATLVLRQLASDLRDRVDEAP